MGKKNETHREGFNMKLKTLKDIATAFVNGKYEIRGVREDELKAEAIKWWKKEFGCGEDVCCTCEEMWREFFNITESDLSQRDDIGSA